MVICACRDQRDAAMSAPKTSMAKVQSPVQMLWKVPPMLTVASW